MSAQNCVRQSKPKHPCRNLRTKTPRHPRPVSRKHLRRSAITAELEKAEDWLYEEGKDLGAKAYAKKLKELQKQIDEERQIDELRGIQKEAGLVSKTVPLGMMKKTVLLDLDYEEDSSVDVDCNICLCENGNIVEIQGSAEGEAMTPSILNAMVEQSLHAQKQLLDAMHEALKN